MLDEFKLFCDDERANDIEFTLFDDISLMGGPDGVLPSLADKASASLLDDTHDVSWISANDVSGISMRNLSDVGEHLRWFMGLTLYCMYTTFAFAKQYF